MRLYALQDVPIGFNGDRVYGQSRFQKLLGFAVVSLLAAGSIWAGIEGGYRSDQLHLPPFLLFWVGGVFGFLALLLLFYAWASFRASNWVLRTGTENLLVNFRSHLNRHLPLGDRTVLRLIFSEIEWIRKIRQKVSAPHLTTGSEESVFSRTCLDLKLAPEVDLPAILQAMQSEIARTESSHLKHHHYPVQVLDSGVLRIEWTGVRPGIQSVIRDLGRRLPVLPEEHLEAANWRALKGEDLERRIRDLALQGHRVEAIALAQRRCEPDLSGATRLVNSLLDNPGSRKSTGPSTTEASD